MQQYCRHADVLWKKTFVHQLNAAGRAIAHHLHMHIFDMEMMANGLPGDLGIKDSRLVLQVSTINSFGISITHLVMK